MKYSTKRLCESGVLLALATVLSMLKIFEFSFGGSITLLSMLPVILISYRYGVKWGLSCGFVYSVLQMLLGVNTISVFVLPGESQMVWWRIVLMCLLDYVLAYSALGLGGLFRNKTPKKALIFGTLLSLTVCYAFHVLSGAIFFGSYAEWFFGDVMSGTFASYVISTFTGAPLYILYSVIYNGCYMIPEILLTCIGSLAVSTVPFITKDIAK
ncbi:MAG: energy-coupled thiamine transporter ThiT [Clostridia bacterium]|nr:energy-coupled thiamine transporter ThiT [Clostridia bacterium]